jgi:Undecaprenyl-phosphate glucose phosphotransferase
MFHFGAKMKLDPKDLKFAEPIEISELLNGQHRTEIRDAVKRSLANYQFVAPKLVVAATAILDFLVMVAACFGTAAIHPGKLALLEWRAYSIFAILSAASLVFLFDIVGLYQFSTLLTPFRKLPRIVLAWIVLFAFLTFGIFLLKTGPQLSRLWLANLAVSGLFFFLSWRFFLSAFLRARNKDGHFNKRAVLVGGGDNADRVISVIENSPETGISLVGIFDDRDDIRAPNETKGLYKLGRIEDLVEFVRSTRIDTIIVTLPTYAEERLTQILDKLWVLPVDIRLSAQGQKLRYRPRSYSYIGNLPCLDVYDKPLGEWGPVLKSMMDRVFAALMLVAISPVFLAIAIAIKWDSKGPVFFKQKRYGFNNDLIEVYKFRSMYVDQADANASKLVTKGDPRVTRVGRFIRRTTLDELPQFFNVLKGSLSLVGPRPHATQAKAGTDLYEHVVDGYFARHRVKPGITGWAQINGWRGETDTAEKIERRVEHDLFYIENWSLTFDLYILLRTPLALLNTESAY